MNLTAAQKTALKAHMQANTNLTPATAADGTALPTPFVINTRLVAPFTSNPENERAIAEWYNLTAGSGDNQAFPNRQVWNPFVTLAQINAALLWQTDPAGTAAADRTNAWLCWQSMTWGSTIDMSDPQVRKGVLRCWGDIGGGNAANIGGTGCGQKVGTNLELVCSNAVVGSSVGGALTNAHPVQKDNVGGSVYGQLLTQPNVHDILVN